MSDECAGILLKQIVLEKWCINQISWQRESILFASLQNFAEGDECVVAMFKLLNALNIAARNNKKKRKDFNTGEKDTDVNKTQTS